jgi:hypothetical protein
MSETNNKRHATTFFARFARIARVARYYLSGPRSAMLPGDPIGSEFWLEPIVRLTIDRGPNEDTKSWLVLSVPNCLERDKQSPVLVRQARWNSVADKETCRQGNLDLPSVAIVYKALSTDQITLIDQLLRNLDKSLVTFSFVVEGLEFLGSSGFTPLPEDAVIMPPSIHYKLARTTRLYYVEFHWQLDQDNSPMATCCEQLVGTLNSIMEMPSDTPEIQVIEKYDIDPKTLQND